MISSEEDKKLERMISNINAEFQKRRAFISVEDVKIFKAGLEREYAPLKSKFFKVGEMPPILLADKLASSPPINVEDAVICPTCQHTVRLVARYGPPRFGYDSKNSQGAQARAIFICLFYQIRLHNKSLLKRCEGSQKEVGVEVKSFLDQTGR